MLRHKTYSSSVNENGATVIDGRIPDRYETIVGMLLHSGDADDLLLMRGSLQLSIGNKEYVEEGEPTRLYLKPVGEGYVALGEIPVASTDRQFRLRYTDSAAASAPFRPHKVYITLFFR